MDNSQSATYHSIKVKFLVNKEKLFEDIMICPVCKEILNDPVSCETCESNFCHTCFENLERNKQKCPNKCRLVRKPPSKILYRILSELVLECENKENGCSDHIKYNNYSFHVNNCLFSKTNCKGCKKEIIKKELNTHEELCELIEIPCEGGCETLLKRFEKGKHDNFACMRSFFEKSIIKLHDEIQVLKTNKKEDEATIEKLTKVIESLRSEINDIKHTLEHNNIYHQSELLNIYNVKNNNVPPINAIADPKLIAMENKGNFNLNSEFKFGICINSVQTSDLIQKGFIIVYLKSYLHKTSFDELISIKNQCNKDTIICVGARVKDSDTLSLCCFDMAHLALTETNNTGFAEKRMEAFWYFYNGYGFGFSKIAKIRLCLPDAEDELGEYRLSWRLTGSDGYRIGMVKDPGESYEKIILICNGLK